MKTYVIFIIAAAAVLFGAYWWSKAHAAEMHAHSDECVHVENSI
jgi:hypothetical protein